MLYSDEIQKFFEQNNYRISRCDLIRIISNSPQIIGSKENWDDYFNMPKVHIWTNENRNWDVYIKIENVKDDWSNVYSNCN